MATEEAIPTGRSALCSWDTAQQISITRRIEIRAGRVSLEGITSLKLSQSDRREEVQSKKSHSTLGLASANVIGSAVPAASAEHTAASTKIAQKREL